MVILGSRRPGAGSVKPGERAAPLCQARAHGRRSPAACRPPAGPAAAGPAAGAVGAVSRLDTALSAVRTVLTLRLAPVLLVVFALVWPIAGFPWWWPLVMVLALGVVLRILGFGYLLAGRRGPVLLVALLVMTTLLAWTPFAAVTGLGAALAVAGAFRLPRWQLLAVGMVLFLAAGAGWVADTVATARQNAEGWAQTSEHNRAQLLPHSPRDALGQVMALVAAGDTAKVCSSGLFTAPAQAQLAAAYGAPDCAGAVAAWHARVTRPEDYSTSVDLAGVTTTLSADRETATVTGCALTWYSPIDGVHPRPRPRRKSPGRAHPRRAGAGQRVATPTPPV